MIVEFLTSGYTPLLSIHFGEQARAIGTLSGSLQLTGGLTGRVSVVGRLSGNLTLTGQLHGAVINPTLALAIDFSASGYTPRLNVVFGDVVSIATGSITGQLQLTGLLVGSCKISGQLHGSFSVTGSLTGRYKINAFRPKTWLVHCAVQSATIIGGGIASTQQQPINCQLATRANHQAALAINHDFASVQQAVDRYITALTAVENDAAMLSLATLSKINLVTFLANALADYKQQAVAINDQLCSIQDVVFMLFSNTTSSIQACKDHEYSIIKDSYSQTLPDLSLVFDFSQHAPPVLSVLFDNSYKVELLDAVIKGLLYSRFDVPMQTGKRTTLKKSALLTNAITPRYGKSPHIDPPRPPPTPQPPDHHTIVIPTRESYAMQHTILVKILPDNTEVQLSKISLSYDVESYSWQFSGTLANKADLAKFNMQSFDPVQLSITIDGHTWRVLVEKVPEKKSFGKTEIQLSGRSLSALLGEPWQLQSSYTAGSDMTVQQIANALIPYDWTIDWQCPTWLIPANTYSYAQQTKLQALKTLVNNIGAVLVPIRNDKVLRVQPRYPILPWHYNDSGITPDLVIPDAAIESINLESRMQSPVNGVYVHGGNNGVLAWCRLNGTAGDVLAPTESNVLITDVTGARLLGERILAGRATQPVTSSVTTFLGGDFPLAEVGQLLAVNNERAIINGVSVDVEFGKIRQTITVGEQTTNAYAKLLDLLPKQPLLVGTLVSTYDDVSILTLIDGGVVTVRGTGTVGQNYYVRNGLIESQAPNLTASEIVI